MASSSDELEELVREEMNKVYTETVVDHAINPRNMGVTEDAAGSGKITGTCGDTMAIWLKVDGDTIDEATFLTDGCGATIAAGSMVTELVRGKTITEALMIGQHDVLNALGGLPEGNVHCALLTANTLKEALKDYFAFKREPWKRVYRKH